MADKAISRIPIRFILEGIGEAEGELIRHMAPRTVDAILRRLPIEGRAALWKDEVYIQIPITVGGEKAKSTAEKGTIAYWPMGSALCIFHEDMKPYSPVNIIGQITKGLELFKGVKIGTKIRVEPIPSEGEGET